MMKNNDLDRVEVLVPGIGRMRVQNIKKKIEDQLEDLLASAKDGDYKRVLNLLNRGLLQDYLKTAVHVVDSFSKK